jgi:hypothetical protein
MWLIFLIVFIFVGTKLNIPFSSVYYSITCILSFIIPACIYYKIFGKPKPFSVDPDNPDPEYVDFVQQKVDKEQRRKEFISSFYKKR